MEQCVFRIVNVSKFGRRHFSTVPSKLVHIGRSKDRFNSVMMALNSSQCSNLSSSTSVTKKNWQDGDLLKKVTQITLQENLIAGLDEKTKVVDFVHPEQLRAELGLELTRDGVTDDKEIDKILKKVVQYSVKTTHPHFYNQLYGGIDEAGLTGAWMLEALNTNQHTFEVAPVFTIIEKFMIEELMKLFDWTKGDGIFAAGGSMSNMYGVALAKHSKYPSLKKTGLFGVKPLALITSDMSHYSLNKAGSWLGFGSDQVYSVKTDKEGRMTADALKKTLNSIRQDGKEAFFVNVTAGTTVFGAFDPINEIAEVCKNEGLWLHVDACWGGGLICSRTHKIKMDGIDKVDSIAWNPHKMLCAPLQCSVFLVKHVGLLQECNGTGATYLFQQDKLYDVSYDTGDKSIQCGRKPDAFKFWMMMKINGLEEFETRVDHAMTMAKYFENQLKIRPGFRLVLEQHEFTNICFWYIPPSMRGQEETEQWWDKMHTIAPKIKSKMVLDGTALIGYQPIASKHLKNFFRIILTSWPKTTEKQMDYILDEFERIGKDL